MFLCVSTDTCTVGQITQIVVYSNMFPFDYDASQFDVCLSLQTLKDNLEAVTDKVYDPEFQRIILNKLKQVTGRQARQKGVGVCEGRE